MLYAALANIITKNAKNRDRLCENMTKKIKMTKGPIVLLYFLVEYEQHFLLLRLPIHCLGCRVL
jgi:hypothetical protein